VGGLGKGLSQAVIAAQGIRGFERGGERVGESDRGVGDGGKGKNKNPHPWKAKGAAPGCRFILRQNSRREHV